MNYMLVIDKSMRVIFGMCEKNKMLRFKIVENIKIKEINFLKNFYFILFLILRTQLRTS